MKLPNGFGSVCRLSGNRRRPWMARKTVGYKPNGRPRQIVIGYYATYAEGVSALQAYNRQPVVERPSITLLDLYRQWLPRQLDRVGASAIEGYQTALKHLQPIVSISISALKFSDVQNCFDNMVDSKGKAVGYASKKKVRTLLNKLLQYGRTNELIDSSINFGPDIDLGRNIPRRPHKEFSRRQINKVMSCDLPEANIVKLLLYSGMRIGELLGLKKSTVKLRSKYFDIQKSKTAAGIRIIPIHEKILPIVEHLMQLPGPYFFPARTYYEASKQFETVMKTLHLKHTTHDCRHTVRTILNERDGNQAAIDRLLGHHSANIGDAVYTHVRLPQLRKTLRLLT